MRFASQVVFGFVTAVFIYPTSSEAAFCHWVLRSRESAEQKALRSEREQKILLQIVDRVPQTPQQAAVLNLWQERRFKDVYKAGRTLDEIERMVSQQAPLGFNTPELWARFKKSFQAALTADRVDDAKSLIDGSSTTFYSLKVGGKPNGYHFESSPGFILSFYPTDEPKHSDYNINVHSAQLMRRLANVRRLNTYTGDGIFQNDIAIKEHLPALATFLEQWRAVLGKKVRVRFYDNWPSPQPNDFFGGWPLQ